MSVSSAVAILQQEEMAPASSPPSASTETHNLIVARVNGEPIFLSEIRERIDRRRTNAEEPGTPGEQSEQLQDLSFRTELEQAIDNRLLCMEARLHLPPEEIARVAYDQADDRREPGSDVNFAGKETPTGTADEAIAAQWLKYRVSVAENCSRQELYAHYRRHMDRYREPGQVRWEQMTARFDRFADREQARAALDFLRRSALGDKSRPANGVNLDALAIQSVEWTSEADLPRGLLGRTLTTLPVGKISPILSDSESLHLVRVLQRRSPHAPALDDVVQIVREDLLAERGHAARQAHLRRLRQSASVWTIHDEPEYSPPTDRSQQQASVPDGSGPWRDQAAVSSSNAVESGATEVGPSGAALQDRTSQWSGFGGQASGEGW